MKNNNTMHPFLAEVAKHIYKNHTGSMEDCCLVFPNRRAAVFFSKYLGNILEKPIWMPRMVTINEFITELGGLQVADSLLLNFELHKIYTRVKKSDEGFDEFYSWGEVLLSDFDDIDKYLVNPHDIFQNLASLKEIEGKFDFLTEEQIEIITAFWKSFIPQKYSEHQKVFIEIWEVLEQIYMEFNILLNDKQLAYEGMVFRKVAEQISVGKGLSLSCSKVFFIGFNALNKCENILFNYLKKEGIAEFYWDYDQYYLDFENHEAGVFVKQNLEKYPSPLPSSLFNNLAGNKNIEALSCASNTGMVKAAGNILSTLATSNPKADFTNTAVVLADETLLLPLLHAIPDEIDKINITMGFPFSQSPIYGLLETLFNIQKTARIIRDQACFYHQHVIEIIDHQLIRDKIKKGMEIKQGIIQENRVYVPSATFKNEALLEKIFTMPEDSTGLGPYLLDIIYMLLESTPEEDDTKPRLTKEFIYFLYKGIKRLDEILLEQQVTINKETYIRLLRQIVRGIKIPFTGEPLAGLQIMGILETRALDFDNLIILSVNEGVLPKASQPPSFIPYNLRKAFGLSAIEHQDTIYAFYFYRLLQRANNVTLIYNSSAEGIKSGEMSRFIYQLKYEPAFILKESAITYNLIIKPNVPIIIEKTPEIMEALDQYTTQCQKPKYLSPSAINTYLNCTLQFYFNHIARLKEAETLTEDVDALLFGNILHKLVKLIYKDYEHKTLQKEDIEKIRRDKELMNKLILQAFSEEYFKRPLTDETELTGKNVLIKDILTKYALQLLALDTKAAPFEIIGLETFHEWLLPVSVEGKEKTPRLGGTIDRIDKTGGNIRIIDYKTGSDKTTFSHLEDLFKHSYYKRNKAAFQVCLYSLLYRANTNDGIPVTPGLYLIKEFFKDTFDYHIKQDKQIIKDFNSIEEEYTLHLKQVLEGLFNPQLSFRQTEEVRICEWCAYAGICGM